jgi:hypothetical protein
LTATWKAASRLVLGAEGLYGREANAQRLGRSAAWEGAAGYVRVDLAPRLSLAARGERFHDGDRFRTGEALKLTECTLTPEVRLTDRMRVRADVRLDHSQQHIFQNDGGLDKDQWTVLLAGLATF